MNKTTWVERWDKYNWLSKEDSDEVKTFLASELQLQRRELREIAKKAIIEAIEETTKEHKTANVYIDMVGEIFLDRFDDIIKKVEG